MAGEVVDSDSEMIEHEHLPSLTDHRENTREDGGRVSLRTVP